MQWFRFYHEALDDPKVQQLDGELFKSWVNLLCLCCRNEGLPKSVSDIAFALRMDLNGCLTVLSRLADGGLLDRLNGGANGMHYAIHGWEKRQFKSDTSTNRVKRFRQRSSNVPVTVDVTAPDTDTDTDTETDIKKRKNIQKEKKVSRSASLAEFDIFWNEYPRRVGKGSAVKAFERALAKTDAKTITDGLDRWKRSKDFPTEERFIPHAATWLNAERWLDIPAETTSGYKIYTEEEKLKIKQETQEWLKEWKKSRDQNQQTSGR